MGLVDYSSSESEDESPPLPKPAQPVASPPPAAAVPPTASKPTPQAPVLNEQEVGPALGPSLPPPSDDSPTAGTPEDDSEPPQSPYTTNRTLIRNLTLPTSIPPIPPSPPGSPPPTLSKKIAHFRELKASGVHFNEKLVKSSALRNPNLLKKLTAHVGLEDRDLYASNVWTPEFAGVNAAWLERERDRIRNEKLTTRVKVEFVSGATTKQGEQDPRMHPRERERRESYSKRDERDRDGRRRGERKREDERDRKRRRSRSASRSRSRDRERDRERRRRDYEYRDRDRR